MRKTKNYTDNFLLNRVFSSCSISYGMKIFFKKLYDYWMKFANLLGRINSVIILTLFFVAVMGVYAIIRKVIVLARSIFLARASNESYWISKKARSATLEELKRQF